MNRAQAFTWAIAVGVVGVVVVAFVRFLTRLESGTARLGAVMTLVAGAIVVAGLVWIVSELGRRQ